MDHVPVILFGAVIGWLIGIWAPSTRSPAATMPWIGMVIVATLGFMSQLAAHGQLDSGGFGILGEGVGLGAYVALAWSLRLELREGASQ